MNVIIIDDHPIIRAGIKSSISLEETIQMVQEASTIEEALFELNKNKYDLAIVDIYLGKESGLDLVQKIKDQGIDVKILMLTSSIKKSDFYKAKSLKVNGYMLKEAYIEDIIYAINIIDRGKIFYHPDVMEFTKDAVANDLTAREYDVLIEIEKGLSNIEIANNLYISEHTVKKHISSILAKLELSNRTELALYAANIMAFSDKH